VGTYVSAPAAAAARGAGGEEPAAGARVVGVPVDADGLAVHALPPRARLVYVSPSHQFPLGVRMSLARRVALLAWAHRTGAVVVEDDYDCEFRYAGRPIEPLQTLDRGGRVVYVGSFSKTMLPTLRLGFCVAPRSLFAALRKAKYLVDWHTALPMQAALAEFIDSGQFARHIRRMRGVYAGRRDRIGICVERDLGRHLALIPSAAGLHLAARLRSGDTEQARAVVKRAATVGVAVRALPDFAWSTFQGRDTIASVLHRHFEDREATWTWTELSRAVDACTTATILYDATYGIPSRNFTQHALVSVVYTRKHGKWLSVIDQSTLLPLRALSPLPTGVEYGVSSPTDDRAGARASGVPTLPEVVRWSGH
jgi:aspartate/methionine/tyrosine aminotransferase